MQLNVAMRRVNDLTNHILWLEHALLYGDSYLGTPEALTSSTAQSSLFLDNGCVASYLPFQFATIADWNTKCPLFYDGIMTSGLHAALQVCKLIE